MNEERRECGKALPSQAAANYSDSILSIAERSLLQQEKVACV